MDHAAELSAVRAHLEALGIATRLVGKGAATFVAATRGLRGAEFYRAEGRWFVDPAHEEDLVGEREFGDRSSALAFGAAWLLAD